jgi:hypothetical protein
MLSKYCILYGYFLKIITGNLCVWNILPEIPFLAPQLEGLALLCPGLKQRYRSIKRKMDIKETISKFLRIILICVYFHQVSNVKIGKNRKCRYANLSCFFHLSILTNANIVTFNLKVVKYRKSPK